MIKSLLYISALVIGFEMTGGNKSRLICDNNKKYTIENTEGKLYIIPDDFVLDTPSVATSADLNADGKSDFILNFANCGNYGDCVYGIFIQCDRNQYINVYEPDYWLFYKISTAVDKNNWKEIYLYDRDDIGFAEGRRKEIVFISDTLKFNGNMYSNR